jgi:hypothetical protein
MWCPVRCIKRGNEAGLLLEVRDRDLALSDDVIGQVRPALGPSVTAPLRCHGSSQNDDVMMMMATMPR